MECPHRLSTTNRSPAADWPDSSCIDSELKKGPGRAAISTLKRRDAVTPMKSIVSGVSAPAASKSLADLHTATLLDTGAKRHPASMRQLRTTVGGPAVKNQKCAREMLSVQSVGVGRPVAAASRLWMIWLKKDFGFAVESHSLGFLACDHQRLL